MIEFTCTKDIFRVIHGKNNYWYQKEITCTSLHWKDKLRKYLRSLLSIVIDEADLEKRTNKFINDTSKFNNKHIIHCYSETKSNIPEEQRYISSMKPSGFINDKDESRCYFNSSFQVFSSIYFSDCDKII